MRRNRCSFAALLVALSFMAASAAHALPESQIGSIKKTVVNTPVIELGPTAAKLVREASKEDRQTVAVTVVRTAVFRKPSSALAVVEAVTKEAPEAAAFVAAAAAELAPEQAALITKVAAENSPEKAPVIAAAVAKVAPSSARMIARAAMISVPGATPQIVSEVIAAVPAQTQAIQGDRLISVIKEVATIGQQTGVGGGGGGFFTTFPTGNVPDGTETSTGGSAVPRNAELTALINALGTFSAQDQATILAEASKIVNAALTLPVGGDQKSVQDSSLSGFTSILNDNTLTSEQKAAFISNASGGLANIIKTAGTLNKASFTSQAVNTMQQIIGVAGLSSSERASLIGSTLNVIAAITGDAGLAGNGLGQSQLISFVTYVVGQVSSLSGNSNYTQAELQALLSSTVQAVNQALGQPGSVSSKLETLDTQFQALVNSYASP